MQVLLSIVLTKTVDHNNIYDGEKVGQSETLNIQEIGELSMPCETIVSPTISVERRRVSDHEDESVNDTKLPRHDYGQVRPSYDKGKFVENWVDESCPPRNTYTDDYKQISEVVANMSRNPRTTFHLPRYSFEASSTMQSVRSTASVHDLGYKKLLSHRKIFIKCEKPPHKLIQRTQQIITQARSSSQLDDEIVQKLQEESMRLWDKCEATIISELAPHLVPAKGWLANARLVKTDGKLWSDAVPVPTDQSSHPALQVTLLPLPKPKPDLTFGYSDVAFSEEQRQTMSLLIDSKSMRNYAMPDQEFCFPFLTVEFKSQAGGGTQYIATCQAAGAGAIALNGTLELMRRSLGSIPYNEPQFFSITMDHEVACLNVHWLKAPTGEGLHSFHLSKLSTYVLDDPKSIRAFVHAIRNILDYGAHARLHTLCKALDAYRSMILRNGEAANAQVQTASILPQPQEATQNARGDLAARLPELLVLGRDKAKGKWWFW